MKSEIRKLHADLNDRKTNEAMEALSVVAQEVRAIQRLLGWPGK